MHFVRIAFAAYALASLCHPAQSYAQQTITGTVFDAKSRTKVEGISVQVLVLNEKEQLAQLKPPLVGKSNGEGEFTITIPKTVLSPITVSFYDVETRTEGVYETREIQSLSGTVNLMINPAIYRLSEAHASSLRTSTRSLATIASILAVDERSHLNAHIVELVRRQQNAELGNVRFGGELDDLLSLTRPQRADIASNGSQVWDIVNNSIRGFTWPDKGHQEVVACNIDSKIWGPAGFGKKYWLAANNSGPLFVAGPEKNGVDSVIVHYDPKSNTRVSKRYIDVILSAASLSGFSRYSSVGTAEGSVLVLDSATQETIATLEIAYSPVTATGLSEGELGLTVVGATVDGRLKVWRADKQSDGRLKPFSLIKESRLPGGFPNSVTMLNSGERVIVGTGIGSHECGLSIIDIKSDDIKRKETRSAVITVTGYGEGKLVAIEQNGTLSTWKFDEDGRFVRELALENLDIESLIGVPGRTAAIIKIRNSKRPLSIPLEGVGKDTLQFQIKEIGKEQK